MKRDLCTVASRDGVRCGLRVACNQQLFVVDAQTQHDCKLLIINRKIRKSALYERNQVPRVARWPANCRIRHTRLSAVTRDGGMKAINKETLNGNEF